MQHPDGQPFDLHQLLGFKRKEALRFSMFIERFFQAPEETLHTSAGTILAALRHFGMEIIIRSGMPVFRYKVFSDPFSNGLNAVFGQEFCIKRIIDVIDSVDQESGPKRGIVLVGPPASGKTNIVDLVALALEQYTREKEFKLYTFSWSLRDENGREISLRSALNHNPLLLIPTALDVGHSQVIKPRAELFAEARKRNGRHFDIPSFYQYATLDKRSLDILQALLENQRNHGKDLYDILEEYVSVEEYVFSVAQGDGIANVDDMAHLQTLVRPFHLAPEDVSLVHTHLQGKLLTKYDGPILDANRGLLHIHDAFGPKHGGSVPESDYKPLLMLLGSGRISVESTQASVDTTVVMTTNLDEMDGLERQLTSSKLLDRIEKIPVNYLLDFIAEMDILSRDMAIVTNKYDVDPNLFRIAAAYAALTRLYPPSRKEFPSGWSKAKCELYNRITPEQKLLIYSCQPDDPVQTISRLPPWHPFRNECFRQGINIFNPDELRQHIVTGPDAPRMEESPLFSPEDLALIDDEFMRLLREEHFPDEGRHGLSVRQLQNIMRNTIAASDGLKLTVSLLITELYRLFQEGPAVHHWLAFSTSARKPRRMGARSIGPVHFDDGEANYEDYPGLIKAVKALYFTIIVREITVCTVNRDPSQIESDLRKYLQHALLDNAHTNKAFSHILIPRYTYIDTASGKKIDTPDMEFMVSIEKILAPERSPMDTRKAAVAKFLTLLDRREIALPEGRPLIASSNDNLVAAFSDEFHTLLSHHRAIEGINPDEVKSAFYHKAKDVERFNRYAKPIQDFVEAVIENMGRRYHYSEEIALDTILYALRENIIDINDLIR